MIAFDTDIHAVAGLLKRYFRELPDPLFTDALYMNFVQALGKPVVSILKYCCYCVVFSILYNNNNNIFIIRHEQKCTTLTVVYNNTTDNKKN